MTANQNLQSCLVVNIIVATNFKTNIGTLQRTFRTYKRTFEVIFQKRTEIKNTSSTLFQAGAKCSTAINIANIALNVYQKKRTLNISLIPVSPIKKLLFS